MRRIYITHDLCELLMASIQLHLCVWCVVVAVTAQDLVLRAICAHAALATFGVCYAFLFTMSGSRERERAANESDKERAHG